MPQRIIKVPAEGDCFFHVVAYFLGDDPADVSAALQVRRNLAQAAASLLFQSPYNNLDTLTDLVLKSISLSDLGGVQLKDTPAAESLNQLHQAGPYLDGGNGGGLPLAVFVVWMQYSLKEIEKLKKGSNPAWLRARGFLNYTIWGDAAFTASLVRRCYEMDVDFYTSVNVGQLNENAANTVNAYVQGGNHFDVVIFEEDEEDDDDDQTAILTANGPAPHILNLTLEVHHLDIGQGDSTLIVVRDHGKIIQSVLIDAADAGEAQSIHDYMNRLGIVNLDWLAITHYDKDHFRGALALLNESKICQNVRIFDRGDPEDIDRVKKLEIGLEPKKLEEDRFFPDEISELKELLDGAPRKRRVCAGKEPDWMVGKVLMGIGEENKPSILSLTCVAANGYVLGGKYVRPLHSDRENALSLCFLLRFGSFAYYFGGDSPGVPSNDLETAVGQAILEKYQLDHVCDMKASHHGSHHSTSAGFVDLLNPTCAFISCGINDKFLHPRQEPIDALQGCGGLQNFYLTRCAYRRNHITPHGKLQLGKARVAGDEKILGTIVLRIEHSTANIHIFYVGYWDREARTWRVNRHCCTHDEIYEEITFREERPEDLVVTACADTQPAKHIEQTVLLEDAIERQRAAQDESIVRSFKVDREAKRSVREGDEMKEEKELKTVETDEMLIELDEKVTKEIEMKENQEYDDDGEYTSP